MDDCIFCICKDCWNFEDCNECEGCIKGSNKVPDCDNYCKACKVTQETLDYLENLRKTVVDKINKEIEEYNKNE